MKKLFIKTYGCQMNVYDSRRMAGLLAAAGYKSVDTPDGADLIILNTCHIREKAAEKVYSDIGRLKKLNANGATLLAVGGCVGQAEGPEIMRRAPAVDMVFGPQTLQRLPDMLARAEAERAAGRKPRILDTDFPTREKFDFLTREEPGATHARSAFLTIQEGCDKFCTFCVVPYTRGAEVSRPVPHVLAEARRLVAAGVRDITLLGQNVNAYHGRDDDGAIVGLGALIRRLGDVEGLARIRYTTSHPIDFDDDLIAAHRDVPQCMPYLHLPVQAGSDKILKAMNRHHSADDYRRVIDRLRAARPDIALSGDFIVGFPGESDADFAATLQLVEQVGYAQAYSFKYSPRPGTPAAAQGAQVDEAVKTERLAELQARLNRQQLAFNEAMVGRTLDVLLERPGKHAGQMVGRSPYMQAVHVEISASATQDLVDGPAQSSYSRAIGQLVPLEIIAAGPNSLEGRLLADVTAAA